MPLATTSILPKEGAPTRTMLFLHGILGNRANLRSVARRFVERRPDWAALLVDLREHGDSTGMPGDPTLDACATDLLTLDDVAPAPIRGAVGHSFGGKVALAWTTKHEADEAWLLDSSPGVRDADGLEAERVIATLRTLERRYPDGFERREGFIAAVRDEGFGAGIAEWLAMSLKADEHGRRRIRVDLERIEALLESYARTDLWGLVESPPDDTAIHLVVADRSNVYRPEDRARANAIAAHEPRVRVHLLPNAGHWLHVDAPDALDALLGAG